MVSYEYLFGGRYYGTIIKVDDGLQVCHERIISRLHTSPTIQWKHCQKKMIWINFPGQVYTLNKYTTYQRKEPGIKSEYIFHKYNIGLIRGGLKPIQLVTYGYKIGFP